MSTYSAPFWAGLGERALKTFAQSLAASLAVGTGLLDVDWLGALGIAGTATLLSVLTSIANPGFTEGKAEPETVTTVETQVVELTPSQIEEIKSQIGQSVLGDGGPVRHSTPEDGVDPAVYNQGDYLVPKKFIDDVDATDSPR